MATANLDFFARARHNDQLLEDLANSSLVVADGAPVVWSARLAGLSRTSRVTGVDLVGEVCRIGAPHGLRVALYGSTWEVARAASSRLEADYPGVESVAIVCPPLTICRPARLTIPTVPDPVVTVSISSTVATMPLL